MPIRKEKYHPKWKLITRLIRRRAGNHCEECGVENARIIKRGPDGEYRYANELELEQFQTWRNYKLPYWDGLKEQGLTRIILTTAHLDRNTQNNHFWNLKCLCQRCHFMYDRPANDLAKKYGKYDSTLELF